MGITMTEDVAHYLQVKDGNRSSRLTKVKTTEHKKRRKQNFYLKLKVETEIAKEERNSKAGIYKSGIGMDSGYAGRATNKQEDHGQQSDDGRQMKTAASFNATKICIKCKEAGHSRPWSKLCRYYQPRSKRKKSNDTKQRGHTNQEDEERTPQRAEDLETKLDADIANRRNGCYAARGH